MASMYWLKRALENDARNQRTEDAGIEKIQNAFSAAEEVLLSRIEAFYEKYNEDGRIDISDIRSRLTPTELTAFRKKITTLAKTASTPEEKAQLEQLKRRVYLSRQEALLAEVRHYATELGHTTEKVIGETLAKIYADQESHQHYNLEQNIGWGVDFEGLAPSQIQALIHQGYGEDDFSSRVWRNTTQLVKNLNVLLPQQFLLGRSTQDLARELSKLMNTPRYSAEATIRTEGSNIAAQADMHTYGQAGVETYEFLATLDERTSEICQSLDGMHFKVKDAQAGVNLPPMHVNCRSTTLPDVDMEDYDETRLAKDEDGQYVVVPKQSYSEWKASLPTRDEAPAVLQGGMVSWRDLYGPVEREVLVEKAKKFITGEVPDDVAQAMNDPEMLKKIRANAQTTLNENANRYLKTQQQLNAIEDQNSAEALKLKADMDRYANKIVMYTNKLSVIDSRPWERAQEAVNALAPSNIFRATSVAEMRRELEETYKVGLFGKASSEKLPDELVEHVYSGLQKMYEKEPEMVLKGLQKMPNISLFTDRDRSENKNTYAWVWNGSARMQLNGDYFLNPEKFKASYERTVRQRFHPKGGDYYSVFIHEFGHVIDNAYFGNTKTTKVANAIKRAWARAKKTGNYFDKVDFKNTISEYATRNNAETIAEAWTDWIDNGENATEATKLIIAEFKKEVAKL